MKHNSKRCSPNPPKELEISSSTLGNAAKPINFYPLPVDAAVAALLKVKPPAKPEKK
jgi:hypothetical protein